MADFAAAYKKVLGNEGGFVDNPADPGGATMYGITQRTARAHGYTGPMRLLPLGIAYAIAKPLYWDAYQCDRMPQAIAFQVLDAAYNGGQPAKWLQQALGVAADGVLGPATFQALDCADVGVVVARFIAYRLQYWTSLPQWSTFGKGWTNRAAADLLEV